MAQFYLYASDEGTVYPVLGRDTAGLPDHGAQIALCEAETVGIVAYLVMLSAMLSCQLDKPVEDGLFARSRYCLNIRMPAKQLVVVMHQGCHQCCHSGAVIVATVYHVPDAVEYALGCRYIVIAGMQLEVAHLTIEGWRHL